jgi:hypothetical protein
MTPPLSETESGRLEIGANTYTGPEKGRAANSSSELLASKDERTDTGRVAQPDEAGSSLVVGWTEPEDQDPENPRNWSSMKKWVNILTISVISFLV